MRSIAVNAAHAKAILDLVFAVKLLLETDPGGEAPPMYYYAKQSVEEKLKALGMKFNG